MSSSLPWFFPPKKVMRLALPLVLSSKWRRYDWALPWFFPPKKVMCLVFPWFFPPMKTVWLGSSLVLSSKEGDGLGLPLVLSSNEDGVIGSSLVLSSKEGDGRFPSQQSSTVGGWQLYLDCSVLGNWDKYCFWRRFLECLSWAWRRRIAIMATL